MPPDDLPHSSEADELHPLTRYGSTSSTMTAASSTAPAAGAGTPSSTPRGSIRKSHHRRRTSRVLTKTQSQSFMEDARAFAPGSLPHSMVLAVTIGTVCGVAAFLYYAGLEWMLDMLWQKLPETYASQWPQSMQVLWIPMIVFPMAVGVGLTVVVLGEPGDLPYTIKCVHEKAFISMDHVLPMVAASQLSILAGGSLGPEAPLVAICASLGGFVSRQVFGTTSRNLIRKHTLMGMAGALAAFFGVPLGGSLFALEVNSRFGIEYFEHTMEAILCGEVCLAVFRALAQLPIVSLWNITPTKLPFSTSIDLVYGALLGVVGAGIAWLFARFHRLVMGQFRHHGLLHNDRAVSRALVGATVIVVVGMILPQTMFWGEQEFQTLATLGPNSNLPHIWPTRGLFDFEMNSFPATIIVGIAKLVVISFTVAGGYRGGYIFPAFAAAAALGRGLAFLLPFIPTQLCVLCMAAAINVALTRTAIATTLILAFLSGEQNATASILAAALMSLFLTGYMPFIQTQVTRNDLEDAIFADFGNENDDDPTDATEPLTPMSEVHKRLVADV